MKTYFRRKSTAAKLFGLSAILLSTFLFNNCSTTNSTTAFDHHAMLRSLAGNVILPSYQKLHRDSLRLHEAASQFCASPQAQNLGKAQQVWRETQASLKRTEAFAFGPYKAQHFDFAIDFWPTRPDALEELVKENEALDLEKVQSIGVSSKGLPAIEYLLFSESAADESPLEALQDSSARCAALVFLAEDLSLQTAALAATWDPAQGNFLQDFAEPGDSDSSYLSLQATINDLVNGMGSLLELAKDTKLGKPLGTKSGGVPAPSLVESLYSRYSTGDLIANLEGLKNLYQGDFESNIGIGLEDLIHTKDPWMATGLVTLIDEAIAELQAIPVPLDKAVVENRESVHRAYSQLREVRDLIAGPLSGLLGVAPYFSSNDGD